MQWKWRKNSSSNNIIDLERVLTEKRKLNAKKKDPFNMTFNTTWKIILKWKNGSK